MVRVMHFVAVMIKCGIEKIVMKILEWLGLEDTSFGKFIAALFRRLGNLMTRFKWTDPKKDMWGSYDSMIEAMHNKTWSPELQRKLDKADNRREMWDNIRSQIVWITVLVAITLYADPWGWNLF